ncbi:MAG: hypothetical protein Q9202_005412 [Teloschistes flavicans]
MSPSPRYPSPEPFPTTNLNRFTASLKRSPPPPIHIPAHSEFIRYPPPTATAHLTLTSFEKYCIIEAHTRHWSPAYIAFILLRIRMFTILMSLQNLPTPYKNNPQRAALPRLIHLLPADISSIYSDRHIILQSTTDDEHARHKLFNKDLCVHLHLRIGKEAAAKNKETVVGKEAGSVLDRIVGKQVQRRIKSAGWEGKGEVKAFLEGLWGDYRREREVAMRRLEEEGWFRVIGKEELMEIDEKWGRREGRFGVGEKEEVMEGMRGRREGRYGVRGEEEMMGMERQQGRREGPFGVRGQEEVMGIGRQQGSRERRFGLGGHEEMTGTERQQGRTEGRFGVRGQEDAMDMEMRGSRERRYGSRGQEEVMSEIERQQRSRERRYGSRGQDEATEMERQRERRKWDVGTVGSFERKPRRGID